MSVLRLIFKNLLGFPRLCLASSFVDSSRIWKPWFKLPYGEAMWQGTVMTNSQQELQIVYKTRRGSFPVYLNDYGLGCTLIA